MAVCRTCDKRIGSHGIARHRAMHRDRFESCVIKLADGTWLYDFRKCATCGHRANEHGFGLGPDAACGAFVPMPDVAAPSFGRSLGVAAAASIATK